jgi:hypothetical protein
VYIYGVYKQVSTHPKRDTRPTTNKLEKERNNANASAKSKELQPIAQRHRFAAHLLLPQPHDRPTLLQFIRKQTTN